MTCLAQGSFAGERSKEAIWVSRRKIQPGGMGVCGGAGDSCAQKHHQALS